jgi:hypothetical protein
VTRVDDGGEEEGKGEQSLGDERTNTKQVRNKLSRLTGVKQQQASCVAASCHTPRSNLAMAFSITSFLLFAVFLAIFLLITVPLTGALVRLRANYNPKGLQLDPEDGVQPHTGPVITSFFVMLSRVRTLEVS